MRGTVGPAKKKETESHAEVEGVSICTRMLSALCSRHLSSQNDAKSCPHSTLSRLSKGPETISQTSSQGEPRNPMLQC